MCFGGFFVGSGDVGLQGRRVCEEGVRVLGLELGFGLGLVFGWDGGYGRESRARGRLGSLSQG